LDKELQKAKALMSRKENTKKVFIERRDYQWLQNNSNLPENRRCRKIV